MTDRKFSAFVVAIILAAIVGAICAGENDNKKERERCHAVLAGERTLADTLTIYLNFRECQP